MGSASHRYFQVAQNRQASTLARRISTLLQVQILGFGWGTWIRTKIDGVRVLKSAFPSVVHGFCW